MRYLEKTIRLPRGAACILRSPGPADSAALLEYLRLTSGETPYMIRFPDEITNTEEEEVAFLENLLLSPNAGMIAAWQGGELMGNCGINPIGIQRKLHHRASFGIAVKKRFWGLGVGGALLDAAIRTAAELGYEQLELGVFAGNGRAQLLYASRGFTEIGRTPRAFRLSENDYDDELLMAKTLSDISGCAESYESPIKQENHMVDHMGASSPTA